MVKKYRVKALINQVYPLFFAAFYGIVESLFFPSVL